MLNGTEQGLCNVGRCKHRKMKDRLRCHMHNMRRWRARNPMRAAYNAVRDCARQRHIAFKITFAQFQRFAVASNYLNRKGNGGHCLTIDRINNLRGYTARNIQPLTRAANTIKKARQDAIRMEKGYSWQEAA